MTALLELSFLGRPRIVYEEKSLETAVTNKALALLCYLAMSRHPHPRDEIATLLWPDATPKKAKNSLRVALAALRRHIPDHLAATRQTIAFDTTVPYRLDVAHFEKGVRAYTAGEGDVTLLQQAVALYRGDFLADFHLDDARAFEEWVLSQRAHWQKMVLEALTTLTRAYLEQRAYDRAVTTLNRLLELEPWQESAHRQLMRTLSRMGDYNGALAQYHTCRRLLEEELGVEPMPETTALYERIRVARATRRQDLPQYSTPFVGRQAELEQLNQMLADPTCRLISVVGLGGVGKTHLAVEAARRANQEQALLFLNGVAFVPLTAVSSPQQLPATLVQTLGVSLAGRSNPRMQLLNYLRDKELLLILDGFEHLPASAPLLKQILDAAADVKIMVTSREPLQVKAERRLDLEGLACPPPGVKDLEAYSAVQLFLQAAAQVDASFALTAETETAVGQICHLVAGIPLGLKLAAAWLRAIPVAQIAAEIQQNLDFLTTTMRDLPPRQRSIRAILDYTWGLLSPQEQRVFQALSVFRDSFTAEAVTAVTAAPPRLLASLSNNSLLQQQGNRYQLHELARQYAAEKGQLQLQEQATFRTTHCHYYATFLQQMEPQLRSRKQEQAFAKIRREMGNIRAAWHYAVEQQRAQQLNVMLPPLSLFLQQQNWFEEGLSLFAPAIAYLQARPNPGDSEKQLLATLLSRQGAFYGTLGHNEEALDPLRQSLHLARQQNDQTLVAFNLLKLGTIAEEQDDYQQAMASMQESLAIYERSGDQGAVAEVLRKLGLIEWSQGDLESARRRFQSSREMYRQRDDQNGVSNALNDLGLVAHVAGALPEARAYLQESLEISRRLNQTWKVGLILGNLGLVAEDEGEMEQAKQYYEESLVIAQAQGDQARIAGALEGLGSVARKSGRYLEARSFFNRSMQINKAEGRQKHLAVNYNSLGRVAEALQQYDEARRYHEESYAIFSAVGHRWGMAMVQNSLAGVALVQADAAAARHHALAALRLAAATGSEPVMLAAMVHLAAELVDDRVEQALVVLAFVRRHRATQAEVLARANDIWERRTAALPSPAITAAEKEAQQATLDELVAMLQKGNGR